jgi:hypothetical protein
MANQIAAEAARADQPQHVEHLHFERHDGKRGQRPMCGSSVKPLLGRPRRALWAVLLEHINPDGCVITIDIKDQRIQLAEKLPITQRCLRLPDP